MGKVIALVNQKGGVGKTMLADQAAFWLEKQNSQSKKWDLKPVLFAFEAF